LGSWKEFLEMNEREHNRRINDSLQSGEGNPAYGEDSRDFGEGGQTTLDPDSREEHDIHRDPTIPPGLQPSERLPDERVTGTTRQDEKDEQ
jgi:hypothetical protein